MSSPTPHPSVYDDEPMRPTPEDIAAMNACTCLPHPFDPTAVRRTPDCPPHQDGYSGTPGSK